MLITDMECSRRSDVVLGGASQVKVEEEAILKI